MIAGTRFILYITRFTGVLLLMTLFVSPLQAQNDCEAVGRVQMPIDTNEFSLVQAFGVRSVRHEGRFHTGEDWQKGKDNTAGSPVQAIANGKVTFSSENGWGADGGVVILEHRLPDDTIFYTQYGHLAATGANPLPAQLACVSVGDVIGVIGDVRPAPHLHFEVRTENPTLPGPGYMREIPYSEGWRNPGDFITRLQAAAHPAHLWNLTVENDRGTTALVAPPFLLNDDSLLYLTGRILRRVTADGRILWRQTLEKDAVSINGTQGETLLIYTDGTVEVVNPEEGVSGETWRLDATFSGAPINAGDWLIFPADGNQLVAVDETRRNILWRLDDVPHFVRWFIAGSGTNFTIALLSEQDEVVYISGSGGLIGRAQLETQADFGATPEGDLLVYTRGGLWTVDITGKWTAAMRNAPPGNDNSAILRTERRTYLYDGNILTAFNLSEQPLWQLPLSSISGRSELRQYGTILLLLSSGGSITAINDAGTRCNQIMLPGDDNAILWHNLDDDSETLRIAVGRTIVGIDWQEFTAAC